MRHSKGSLTWQRALHSGVYHSEVDYEASGCSQKLNIDEEGKTIMPFYMDDETPKNSEVDTVIQDRLGNCNKKQTRDNFISLPLFACVGAKISKQWSFPCRLFCIALICTRLLKAQKSVW